MVFVGRCPAVFIFALQYWIAGKAEEMKRIGLFLLLCIAIILLLWPRCAGAQQPGDWRNKEVHGLGVGLIEAHYGDGAKLFYDYTPFSFFQIHTTIYEATVFGWLEDVEEPVETVSRGAAMVFRVFPWHGSGVFAGWGTGRSKVNQNVPAWMAHGEGSTQPAVNSTAEYVHSFFEIGWQGWDGYYFTVSSQRGQASAIQKKDQTGTITNRETRESAQYGFGDAGHIFALSLAFGWH